MEGLLASSPPGRWANTAILLDHRNLTQCPGALPLPPESQVGIHLPRSEGSKLGHPRVSQDHHPLHPCSGPSLWPCGQGVLPSTRESLCSRVWAGMEENGDTGGAALLRPVWALQLSVVLSPHG